MRALLSDFTSSQKWEILACIFYYVYNPKWGRHTGFLFSVRSLFLFNVYLFCFVCPDSVFTRGNHLMGRSALRYQGMGWGAVSPMYLFTACFRGEKSKWMLTNNTLIPSFLVFFSFPEESKKKKDAKMLWMYDWKCHLQDCTFLTVLFTKGIQLHWRKKRDLLYCI